MPETKNPARKPQKPNRLRGGFGAFGRFGAGGFLAGVRDVAESLGPAEKGSLGSDMALS